MSIAVDRLEITAATPAHIAVTLRNHGADTATIPSPLGYSCRLPYIVRDAADRLIDVASVVCPAISYPPARLAPGDSVTIHSQWAANSNSGPVAPGTYRIYAMVWGQERLILSDPVTVSVPAPPAP